jgi:hypothetical protein
MIRSRVQHPRGQVLPLWIVAIMTTFVLMFMALNYGNVIRWQIKAQSAADAAAQGVLSIQTERWNMMSETLYAANVEEYRIRRLLDGILMTMEQSGGCASTTPSATCDSDYMSLRSAYLRAVNRYTADVSTLNDIVAYATYSGWKTDAASFLQHVQGTSCNNSDNALVASGTISAAGGDCSFQYTMVGYSQRTGLNPVEYDASGICTPDLGRTCDTGAVSEVDSESPDFAPLQVDIVTCAIVPPVIPNFWSFKTQPYYAVGRAAATSVMFEQDWFQPGSLYDQLRGPNQPFQPKENYVTPLPSVPTTYDWYNVDFGGNGTTAWSAYNAYTSPVDVDEMSARVGWWAAIPVRPPTADDANVNLTTDCKAAS